MAIIFQRPTVHEAPQHHPLPPAIIHAALDEEALALIGAVVEGDAAILFSALGQVGAVLEHPVQLHDGREQAKGLEGHIEKLIWKREVASRHLTQRLVI